MQWSGEESGGFSTAPPDRQIRPIVHEGGFAYEHVNVASQRRDSSSLLNVVERLIRTRKESPEIGWGTWTVLDAHAPTVFAHYCEWRGQALLALHNLSREPAIARLDLAQYQCDHLIDLLDDREADPIEEGCFETRLPGYGYRWYRIGRTVGATAEGRDVAAASASGMATGSAASRRKAAGARSASGRHRSRGARSTARR
jgi:maltose alpha-D-glucosyltransferase/alpha-amylase